MKRQAGLTTMVKLGSLTDNHYLRDTILKERRWQIWYRMSESVKRQPDMTLVAKMSKTFMNKTNAIILVFLVISSKLPLSSISKLQLTSNSALSVSDIRMTSYLSYRTNILRIYGFKNFTENLRSISWQLRKVMLITSLHQNNYKHRHK